MARGVLDDEVFAVVMAMITVASVLAAFQLLRPSAAEPFTAIGILNERCLIGDYPSKAVVGVPVGLCVYVYNGMGRPIYYKVVFKLASNASLPTSEAPSSGEVLGALRGVLGDGGNATRPVSISIGNAAGPSGGRAALVFELWIYDASAGSWVYSGRWAHLYLDLVGPG